jgi:anti-anti-sigma factor
VVASRAVEGNFAEFVCVVESDREFAYLRAIGDLDFESAPALDTVLRDLTAVGFPQVVVDLTEVTLIDSTGLYVLMRHRDALEARGGELRLIPAPPPVNDVFDIDDAPFGRFVFEEASKTARARATLRRVRAGEVAGR